jgi:hypothetical protein
MSMTTTRRALGATALSSILLPSFVPGAPQPAAATAPPIAAPTPWGTGAGANRSGLDPTPLAVIDVSAAHADLVTELVELAAADGIAIDPSTMRVVAPADDPSDLHVLPDRASLVVADDGRIEVAVAPNPISRWSRQRGTEFRDGPYWKVIGTDCYGRWRYDGVYIDACWRESLFVGDSDTTRTWFALEYWATAGPDGNLLKTAELSARSLTGTANWSDWSPRSDYSGSCSSTSVSVSLVGLSVGQTYDRCETWNVTKYATAQQGLKNRYSWSGGNMLDGSPYDREVALAVSIAIPQSDANQGWYLTRGLDGAS